MELGQSRGAQSKDNSLTKARKTVDAALQHGITLFDLADIYQGGAAEEAFGHLLRERPEIRSEIIVETKCGIRFSDESGPGRYDNSGAWIERAVEASLRRLQTDYIDILLLHRPDALLVPAEINLCFERLKAAGKVREFGLSNTNGPQLEFLQNQLQIPLVVNQLELSLLRHDWVSEPMLFNTTEAQELSFVSGTIEACRRHHVQLQAWGCLARGLFSGRDTSQQPAAVQATAQFVAELSAEYDTSREAIVLAWLMRHPAGIQPILGTGDPLRIAACVQAASVELERGHWYRLLETMRGRPLP
jgi:predicted oxidoreductase